MNVFWKVLKWIGIGLAVLLLGILAISEYKLSFAPNPVAVTLELPSDAQSLAEGERLARSRGCLGCHRENLAGAVFFDALVFARVITPNLTSIFKTQSPAVLEAAVRQGIGLDNRPLVLMPSYMFSYLTDDDTAKIFAYLATVPEVENVLPDNFFGPISRFFLTLGVFKTVPVLISENQPLRFDAATHPVLAKGEYLAMTLCTECHGSDLKGVNQGGFLTPDLGIVAAYGFEDFSHFLKTGEAVGGRDVGLMTEVAISRFSFLHEDEFRALHAFLSFNSTCPP